MKKVITTVGTSLFTNYAKQEIHNLFGNDYSGISKHLEKLEDKPASYMSSSAVKELKQIIEDKWLVGVKKTGDKKWVLAKDDINNDASAELTSILKLKEKLEDTEIQVYLLATDTILSVLAAEMIKEALRSRGIEAFFEDDKGNKYIIRGLQVKDSKAFQKEGLHNLIMTIRNISREDFGETRYKYTILNITGGYKAIVPYMTILGQVFKIDIYYIFEDTNALIKIPPIPINLDLELLEKYKDVFQNLLENSMKTEDLKQKLDSDYDYLASCFDEDGEEVILSTLGDILAGYLKIERFFEFYCSDKVWKDLKEHIERDDNIKRILQLIIDEEKSNDFRNENGHRYYGRGGSEHRIFFFKDCENNDKKVYIYKVFINDHDNGYIPYLNSFQNNHFNDKNRQNEREKSIKSPLIKRVNK